MEKTIILYGLTPDELTSIIERAVESKVSQLLNSTFEASKIKYLTRKEVCDLLKVSAPTLYQWTKSGIVSSHKIGSKVLYKSNEIELALSTRKYKRYHY